MRTLIVIVKGYALGVILQSVIGLGIFVNSQAAPFELCPKMQYYERELGKHTLKTALIWPYFAAKVIMRHYYDELRHSKLWE